MAISADSNAFSACFARVLLLLTVFLHCGYGFRKVLVPSVMNEWDNEKPYWASNTTYIKEHGYEVVIYQKTDPDKPHYLGYNRGRESGVFLKYIVDYYHDFPDIAVFIHGNPFQHQPRFVEMFNCIRKDASYYHLNYEGDPWISRTPGYL